MTAPACIDCGQPAEPKGRSAKDYLRRCRTCADKWTAKKKAAAKPPPKFCTSCGKQHWVSEGDLCKRCTYSKPLPIFPLDAEVPCFGDWRFVSEHREDHLAVKHLCQQCPAASFAACQQLAKSDPFAHGTYAGKPVRLFRSDGRPGRPRKEAS